MKKFKNVMRRIKRLSAAAFIAIMTIMTFGTMPGAANDNISGNGIVVHAETSSEEADGNGKGNMGDGDADGAFDAVFDFFKKWIGKAGVVVGFVGGVMFCFAIKNNDAEQKQAGLLTMIAGFAVAALCSASSLFKL